MEKVKAKFKVKVKKYWKILSYSWKKVEIKIQFKKKIGKQTWA